jgi:hypothetical protein
MATEQRETQTTKRAVKLEDLEQPAELLSDAQAEQAQGGRKAGKEQQEYLVVTMSDILIS